MTTVSIDNNQVDVTLGNGESVTVPTGETWVVDAYAHEAASLTIPAVELSPGYYSRILLTAGTVVKNTGSSLGNNLHLKGWIQ